MPIISRKSNWRTPLATPIFITAGIERNGQRVFFTIADRGPGLPPGDEERVFEKFYRGNTTGPGGAGLGLAICRGIVLAHGGRIWAENRPEGGVAFRFTLPIVGSSQKPETAHA